MLYLPPLEYRNRSSYPDATHQDQGTGLGQTSAHNLTDKVENSSADPPDPNMICLFPQLLQAAKEAAEQNKS
jgi:hypothetical protein